MKLEGKVSLITGGGRGIGRAIALRFAREGSAVLVAGTSLEKIESVTREIQEQGGRAAHLQANVADEGDAERMVRLVLDQFGRIDVLVNNAGIAGPTAPAIRVTRDEWDQVLAINLTGAFLCAKHALPHMIEQGGGRIINITSIAGLMGYALRSPYAASKWGMIGLTKTLAEEAGRYNITVNAIAPGPVRGARIDEVIRRRAAELNRAVEEVERDYVEPTALKRMVEEDDIAAMALFLASDDGRNVTGETLEVSGGYKL